MHPGRPSPATARRARAATGPQGLRARANTKPAVVAFGHNRLQATRRALRAQVHRLWPEARRKNRFQCCMAVCALLVRVAVARQGERRPNLSSPHRSSALPTPDAPLSDADGHSCDVLIVGGGISGVAIARDLAGRGWSVVLCEQDDLGAHTSGATNRILWGGEDALTRGALASARAAMCERETLMRSAPHLVRPLQMVQPLDGGLMQALAPRLQHWLADQLAPSGLLPPSRGIALDQDPLGRAVLAQWRRAVVYAHAWADDVRLVISCALDAAEHGARILTRTRCESLRAHAGGWRAILQPITSGEGSMAAPDQAPHWTVQARVVVNATGPWAQSFQRQVMQAPLEHPLLGRRAGRQGQAGSGSAPGAGQVLRLLKAPHVVVPRLWEHDHAYVRLGPHGCLALPFEQRFTLIGSTEVLGQAEPGGQAVTPQEIEQLCQDASRLLRQRVQPCDVVWSFCAVRPLLAHPLRPQQVLRREHLLQTQRKPSPWLTVWGGSLGGFRALAQEAANQVCVMLGQARAPWTASAWLPGGDFSDLLDELRGPQEDLAAFQVQLRQRHPWMDLGLARRWSRAYGARTFRLLDGVTSRGDLGQEIAPDLYEAELYHLRRHEWARSADDVLWRRSRLGLHYSLAQREAVASWFAQQDHRRETGTHCSAWSRIA